MVNRLKFREAPAEPKLLRLDLGSGKGAKCQPGFTAVDLHASKGVQAVDLRLRWPWKNDSVDEVHADYLVQYFSARERVHFANELYRVLKPGARAIIVTPYWAANKAYMDLNVCWPPVVEGWYATLSKTWRETQNYVDVSGYACDFDHTYGYGLHPDVNARALEYQMHAVTFQKEAAQDLAATLIKR